MLCKLPNALTVYFVLVVRLLLIVLEESLLMLTLLAFGLVTFKQLLPRLCDYCQDLVCCFILQL